MTTPQLEDVIQAISEADEKGNPATIFNLISEHLIWAYAKTILDDPEQHYQYGPTLLQGIGVALPHLEDSSAVSATILHALKITSTRRRKIFCSLNGQRLALVGPLERLGHRPIVIVDKSQNFGLQVFDRGEGASFEQLANQNRKPDLNLIHP